LAAIPGEARFDLAACRYCFETVTSPIAPAHWEAELTNVVWMAIRAGVLPADEGPVPRGLARRLGIESVATATSCQGALLRAVTAGVPVYDTLFVELAARAGCPLVTLDSVRGAECGAGFPAEGSGIV
jgi:predicted nucleic acid-binding protein